MATEAEQAKSALERRLADQEAQTVTRRAWIAAVVTAANAAADAVDLDEADTRQLIDEELRKAGWIADSATLKHSRGARPEKRSNLAIAEWPTANGPADYV